MNGPAVAQTLRALLLRPRLLLPQASAASVAELDWAALRARGVRALVLDKDNTITVPHALRFLPGAEAALRAAQRQFGDERVLLFSNSAGSGRDPGFADAARVEDALGVRVLRHGTQKPDGAAQLRAALAPLPLADVALVGDRYTTDVLFANSNGMLAVKTAMVTEEGETAAGLRVRAVEDAVVGVLGRALL